MKKVTEINGKKVPAFYINPELDKYNNVVLCPEKLARANEDVRNSNLLEVINEMKIENRKEMIQAKSNFQNISFDKPNRNFIT